MRPRTQLIDPGLPRGKVGKGPLEPRDSTTRVPAERKGLAGMLSKGPGLKKGGSVKKYKGGGMATKGLGKAFKNSKR
jgi:hypothetical protein